MSGASTEAPKSSGIGRDEWLKALADAGIHDDADDQGAITYAEFAAMMGIPRETAERRLKALEAAGKATRTRKRGLSGDRRAVSYIAFRLVP